MTTGAGRQDRAKARTAHRLPDPPRREPDEVTAYDYLYGPGGHQALASYLGDQENTLIAADRWIVATADANRSRAKRPDLLVALGVSPERYRESNGYISEEHGKPPDFVLEIASASTATEDTGDKRAYYQEVNVAEYWRFDSTGEYHGARLAADRLQNGIYAPIPIEERSPRVLQGYSRALNICLRWDNGLLRFVDPDTDEPLLSYEEQRSRADQAEARNRQLEEELRQLRNR